MAVGLAGHVRFLDLSDTDIRGSACITLAAACKADGERNSFRQQLTCMQVHCARSKTSGCALIPMVTKAVWCYWTSSRIAALCSMRPHSAAWCSCARPDRYLDLRDAGLTCWGGSVDAVDRLVACGGPALDCVRLCRQQCAWAMWHCLMLVGRNGVHDEGAVALAASLQTQKQKVKITLNNAKIGDQATHPHHVNCCEVVCTSSVTKHGGESNER